MYEEYKKQMDLNDISALVDLRRDIDSKLEWASDNLKSEEFQEVLDLYDFITNRIAEHYIQKYH